jgi:hypothetical protein
MAQILPFIRPRQLSPGERPKRGQDLQRTDADRLRDLDTQETANVQDHQSLIERAPKGQTIGEFFGGDTSLIDFALQGAPPKESA